MENLEILPWDNNFNTGIYEIDIQHQKLVLILNHLATSITYKAHKGELNHILDELTQYTIYHFQTEEKIWQSYFGGDSSEIEHKKIHQEFIDKVLFFREELNNSSIDSVAKEILDFLAQWLTSHILESDRYLAYIVLAIQEGASVEDAKKVAKVQIGDLTLTLIKILLSSYRQLSTNNINLINEIQKRRQKEEKLQLAASVFTHAREGILITDAHNIIISVNKTFSLITGYSQEEALGKKPDILRSNKQNKKFYAKMWDSLKKDGFWSGEIWNCRKNGELYAQMLTISVVYTDMGQIKNYVALFSDITASKLHQKELQHTAHYDALTNLPNRILLAQQLSQALLDTQKSNLLIAVAFIDIDRFKEVNDLYGHNIGDELLIRLATRMQQTLRKHDIIARIGGDEFVVVFTDLVTIEDTHPILSRLLATISKPLFINNISLNITASIGLSFSHSYDKKDGDQLIRQADQAMYQAKQLGKNRYYLFDEEKACAIYLQHANIQEIKEALKNQEFVLYYQPKIDMLQGKVIGVEALIRWQHPRRGLLYPKDFLPVIEKDILSISLGEWVIATALAQIESWNNMGLTLPISVNINALQLQQKEFASRLEELLAEYPSVEAHFLELEILETSAIEDIVQVSNIMNRCLTLGVKFALDDFGTGYSSLSYLKRLPAHIIKIDQIFVRDMLEDCDDLAIVKGIIGLSQAFGRDVIAEGVESREHGKALIEIGCKLAQGYGISKAIEASKIPQWILSWESDSKWQELIE